jgi:hypothetical protein
MRDKSGQWPASRPWGRTPHRWRGTGGGRRARDVTWRHNLFWLDLLDKRLRKCSMHAFRHTCGRNRQHRPRSRSQRTNTTKWGASPKHRQHINLPLTFLAALVKNFILPRSVYSRPRLHSRQRCWEIITPARTFRSAKDKVLVTIMWSSRPGRELW